MKYISLPQAAPLPSMTFESGPEREIFDFQTYGASASGDRRRSDSSLAHPPPPPTKKTASTPPATSSSQASDAVVASLAKLVKDGMQHARNASLLDIQRKYVLAICEYIWAIRKAREVSDALDGLMTQNPSQQDMQSYVMIREVVSTHSSKYSQRASLLLKHAQSAAQIERESEEATSAASGPGSEDHRTTEDLQAQKKVEIEKQEVKRALEALRQLVESGEKKHSSSESISSLDWLSNSVESVRIGSSSVRSDPGSKDSFSTNDQVSRSTSDQGAKPSASSPTGIGMRRAQSENGWQSIVPKHLDSLFSGWMMQKDGALGLWKKRWFVLCPTVMVIYSNGGKQKREFGLEQIIEVQQMKKMCLKIRLRIRDVKKPVDLQFKANTDIECAQLTGLLNENSSCLKERTRNSKPSLLKTAAPITLC